MRRIPGIKNRLTIEIKGPELVRFLNICAFHRIIFFHAEPLEDGLICQIGISDFMRLYEKRHKAKVSVTVKKKEGIYFWYKKNKPRRAAYVFAAAAFAALYLMSLFLWDISFEGNIRYTDSYLLRFVTQEGYHPGMKLSEISCSELEKAIRNAYEDITWVSARIDGTRLVISVKENQDIEEDIQETVFGDLYADESGIVARMVTRSGTPKVKEGDVVEKGQLLVSGQVPVLNDGQETDHYIYEEASADVWIQYEDYLEYRISRNQLRRLYEKEQTRKTLVVFGKKLSLFPIRQGEMEELYTEQRTLCLFDNFYLPIRIETSTLKSYTEEEIICSDEELKTQADEKLLRYLESLEEDGISVIQNEIQLEMKTDYALLRSFLVLEGNKTVFIPYEEILNRNQDSQTKTEPEIR